MATDDAETAEREPDEHADAIAVLPGGVSISYQENEAAALAAALDSLGVRPDEQVLVVMPDGSGFAEAVIGTLRAAAVPVPVNPSAQQNLMAYVIDADARLVVVPPGDSPQFATLRPTRTVPVRASQGTWATILLLGDQRSD